MFKKRKEKRCSSILNSILNSEENLVMYSTKVKDSIMQNEGNMMQVYHEMSYVISVDFSERNKDVCDKVSMVLVTIIRMSSNKYEHLDCRYHG